MTTIHQKVCPSCACVCAVDRMFCQRCHTSLHRALMIDVPVHLTVDQVQPGERLVVVPPSTARVDEEYLNLFRRPTLYRATDVTNVSDALHRTASSTQQLAVRALLYQILGFLAIGCATIFFAGAFGMTVSRLFAWRFAWLPPTSMWPILVPLGYGMTILQLLACYTALCARDHALNLRDTVRQHTHD